ncbi:Plasmolipin Plasma membrane proteolipid [Larimichthys crocea]|uniref:Plasmolipin n=2 Tax=Larimichthys crocea TaxID=215358 RepID=A0A6G0IZ57_LARCR|nr:plasmolipin [Larimichthys crocea]KAE8296614.1 Plasmolipin Plasma membrane proteolipid [Larimichthys crocea]
MADFPSKVATETSTPHSRGSQMGGSLRGLAANVTSGMNMSFIRSIPAFVMIGEIVMGMIHFSLIASVQFTLVPAYGWVMFVAITLWLLTIILFFMTLCNVQQKVTAVPWPMAVMVFHVAATVLSLTALVTNIVTISVGDNINLDGWALVLFYRHMSAATFFSGTVFGLYWSSAGYSYKDWRGDGGNAATNTVPT